MKTYMIDAYARLWKALGTQTLSKDVLLDNIVEVVYDREDDIIVDPVSDWILIRARVTGAVNETELMYDWVRHALGVGPTASRADLERGRIPVAIQQLLVYGWLYEDKVCGCYRPTHRELPLTKPRCDEEVSW